MPPSRPNGLIRLSFSLGPWRSPRVRQWQTAYDGLVERLTAAGLPIYGILEADLAGGEMGSARWYTQFATNAAAIIERYADRIQTFEVLAGPNRPDAVGKPRLSPAAFARTLALVYEQVKGEGQGRETTLVSGAVSLADDGAGYLAQTLTFGSGSTAWDAVRQTTNAPTPFDAIAFWLALPEQAGPVPPNYLVDQIDRLTTALAAYPAVAGKPLYLSGFTWTAPSGNGFAKSDLDAALARLTRQRPSLRYAARDTTLAGPARHDQAVSLVGAYAIFTPPAPAGRALDAVAEMVTVDGFDFPIGPRNLPEPPSGYGSANGLAPDDYFQQYHAWHTGDDWNGPGPGDADLGLPVYAAAHGVVVDSNYYTPAWGNVILVQHKLPNGVSFWTQYAHLNERQASVGDTVERGQQIGTIGKGADGIWLAHLHFEMRQCNVPANNWLPFVADKQRVLGCYFPTIAFTRKHRPGQFSAAGVIVDSEPGQQASGAFTRSDTPHWFQSYYGWNSTSLWTFASVTETEWGEWRPQLSGAGRYEVQVWIPSFHATTHNAHYTITHADGTAQVALDQDRFNDEWASLGSYNFNAAGAVVRLSDQTGEADSARLEVCFDAIRWLPSN